MSLKYKQAFTLLEVMIFTTILSVVLVSAAAFTTRLVYNLRINEHKIIANIHAADLLEWLNSEREANWFTLYNMASDAGTTYCVNGHITVTTTGYNPSDTSVFRIPTVSNPCLYDGIDGRPPEIFKRELILRRNGANQVTATVKVTWLEGETTYSDEIQAIFTSW